jgi:hypothetical protein
MSRDHGLVGKAVTSLSLPFPSFPSNSSRLAQIMLYIDTYIYIGLGGSHTWERQAKTKDMRSQ